MLFLYVLTLASALHHADLAVIGPAATPEVNAVNCGADVPSYLQFAVAIDGERRLVQRRGWKRVSSHNPFMNE
ncbi:hypothetical protein [Sphingomonas sp. R86521]|uniref:hypothetical protein n=1 Tax=Sphingomonas sp. R86521 TaxID=3093860 RepID=UPI0036D33D55